MKRNLGKGLWAIDREMRKLYSLYLLHSSLNCRVKDNVFDGSTLEDSLCSFAKKITSEDISCGQVIHLQIIFLFKGITYRSCTTSLAFFVNFVFVKTN